MITWFSNKWLFVMSLRIRFTYKEIVIITNASVWGNNSCCLPKQE